MPTLFSLKRWLRFGAPAGVPALVLLCALSLSAEEPGAAVSTETQAPAAAEAGTASTAPAGAAASEKPAQPLDVTITGELKEEIIMRKDPPGLDVPFREVVPFSRENQTETLLREEVQYMSLEDQNKLIEMHSLQTISPAPVLIPSPPFFRMEIPREASLILSTASESGSSGWRFQVVDQNNNVLKVMEGVRLPPMFFEWDGYNNGIQSVKSGPAYSSVLQVTDAGGRIQRFFGEAIQMDALQYEQDGLLHVEFNNNRLYERGGSALSPEILPLVESALDLLRLRIGTPLRLVVYEAPERKDLAQRRLETWKAWLVDNLMINADDITVTSMPIGDRGPVTSLLMLAKP